MLGAGLSAAEALPAGSFLNGRPARRDAAPGLDDSGQLLAMAPVGVPSGSHEHSREITGTVSAFARTASRPVELRCGLMAVSHALPISTALADGSGADTTGLSRARDRPPLIPVPSEQPPPRP